MDSTESVPGLVRDNLPLTCSRCSDNDVGTRIDMAIGLRVASHGARLAEPSQTNSSGRVTGREQCPMAVVVFLGTSPCGEVVESQIDVYTT